jgi:hypothetical protein
LEFLPNLKINGNNPQAGPDADEFGFSGQISNGDHDLTGCFHFNVYGTSIGCNTTGPNCDFTFSGYQIHLDTQAETLIAAQEITIPACPALQNCVLSPVTLGRGFQNLTHVRINATVESAPVAWWMDDLRLGWFDNFCKAGLCRSNAHIH